MSDYEWDWDPDTERQGIESYNTRKTELDRMTAMITPDIALQAANTIRYYPQIEPDVIVAGAVAGLTADSPTWLQIHQMQEEQHRSWFTRNVIDNLKSVSRYGFAGVESVYNSMPHTQGLRAITGMVQGMSPMEAYTKSSGTQLQEIQRANLAGDPYTMGTGWFAQPVDPVDSPEYQKAFLAEIDRQIQNGVPQADIDLARADAIGRGAMPVDIAQRAIDAAERIRIQSRHGGDPAPVSMGSVIGSQFVRPGTAPYVILSGSIDLPFRIGADPLNVPFWRWEDYWAQARSAIVAAERGGVLETAAAIPPDAGFDVRVAGRTYRNVDEFYARFNELQDLQRNPATRSATEAERAELGQMQGAVPEGSTAGDIWRAHLDAQRQPSLPPGEGPIDPMRAEAIDRMSRVPADRGLVPPGATPHLTLVDDPMESAGGWAVKKGFLNRLATHDVDNAAAHAERVVTAHVPEQMTQLDRDEIYGLVTGSPELTPSQTARVERFLLNRSPDDQAWFSSRHIEASDTVAAGIEAENLAAARDAQIKAHAAWQAEAQNSGVDVVHAHIQRIADLENGRRARAPIDGVDNNVRYGIDEMPEATSAATQAAAPAPTTDPADFDGPAVPETPGATPEEKAANQQWLNTALAEYHLTGRLPTYRDVPKGMENIFFKAKALADEAQAAAEAGEAERRAAMGRQAAAGGDRAIDRGLAGGRVEDVRVPEPPRPSEPLYPEGFVPAGPRAQEILSRSIAEPRPPGSYAEEVYVDRTVNETAAGVMALDEAERAEWIRTHKRQWQAITEWQEARAADAAEAGPAPIRTAEEFETAYEAEEAGLRERYEATGVPPVEEPDALPGGVFGEQGEPVPEPTALPDEVPETPALPSEEFERQMAEEMSRLQFLSERHPRVPPNKNPSRGITYQGRVKTIHFTVDIFDPGFEVDRTRRRIMITGTRNKKGDPQMDREAVQYILEQIAEQDPGAVIVHGMAIGVDKMADEIAQELGLRVERHPVDGETWNRYPSRAGNMRNERMVNTGIDEVFAFPVETSKGTVNAMRYAEDRGIQVTTVRAGQELDVTLAPMGGDPRGTYSGAPPRGIGEDQIRGWNTMVDNLTKRAVVPEVVRKAMIDAEQFDELAQLDEFVEELGPVADDVLGSQKANVIDELGEIQKRIGRFEGSMGDTEEIRWEQRRGAATERVGLPEGVRRVQPAEGRPGPIGDDASHTANRWRAYYVDKDNNLLGYQWTGKPELAPPNTYRPPRPEAPSAAEIEAGGRPPREGDIGMLQQLRRRLPDVEKEVVNEWWKKFGIRMFEEDAGEAGVIEQFAQDEIVAAAAKKLRTTAINDPLTPFLDEFTVEDYVEQVIGPDTWRRPWVKEWWENASERLRARGSRTAVSRQEINRFLEQELGPRQAVKPGDISRVTKKVEERLDYLEAKQKLNGAELAELDQLTQLHRRLPGSATTKPTKMTDPWRTQDVSQEAAEAIEANTRMLREEAGIVVEDPQLARERRVGVPLMEVPVEPPQYQKLAEEALTPARIKQLVSTATRPANRVIGQVRPAAQRAAYLARYQIGARYGYLQAKVRQIERLVAEGDEVAVATMNRLTQVAEEANPGRVSRQTRALTGPEVVMKDRVRKWLNLSNDTLRKIFAANVELGMFDRPALGWLTTRVATGWENVDVAGARQFVKDARASANKEIKRLQKMAAESDDPINVSHSLEAAREDVRKYAELLEKTDEELAVEVAEGRTPISRPRRVELEDAEGRLIVTPEGEIMPLTPENVDVRELRSTLERQLAAWSVNGGDFVRGPAVPHGETVQIGSQMVPVEGAETGLAPREVGGPLSIKPILPDPAEYDEYMRLYKAIRDLKIDPIPVPQEMTATLAGETLLRTPDVVEPLGRVAKVGDVPIDGENVIYVGRNKSLGGRHPFASPFPIGSKVSPEIREVLDRLGVAYPNRALKRGESLELYRAWLWDKMRREPETRTAVAALHGKTLVCHCVPKYSCHAEILAQAATWAKKAADEAVTGVPDIRAIQPRVLKKQSPFDRNMTTRLAQYDAMGPEEQATFQTENMDLFDAMMQYRGTGRVEDPKIRDRRRGAAMEARLSESTELTEAQQGDMAARLGMGGEPPMPTTEPMPTEAPPDEMLARLGMAPEEAAPAPEPVPTPEAVPTTEPSPAAVEGETGQYTLPDGTPIDRQGFTDYLGSLDPEANGLPIKYRDRMGMMQVVYGLEDAGIPLESVLIDRVILEGAEWAPGPPGEGTVQGAGVPLVRRVGKKGRGVGTARQLNPTDFDNAKLIAAGSAPPMEPPAAPRTGAVPDEPDDDTAAELVFLRSEKKRAEQWIADNPEPEFVDPVDDEVVARRDAGHAATEVRTALGAFLDRMYVEPRAAIEDLAMDEPVAASLRRATPDQLGAETGRTPAQAQETLDWMEQVGLVGRDEAGTYGLVHSDPTAANAYFDHLTELNNRYRGELQMMNEDPELLEATRTWQRDVISTAADEQIPRAVSARIAEPLEDLTGEWAHDFGIIARRLGRMQDIAEQVDDIADEAVRIAHEANRGSVPDLESIGFDREAFRQRLRDRVSAWVNIAARDHNKAMEIRSLARGLARHVGKAGVSEEIEWFAQKMMEASVNNLKLSPLGPGWKDFERSILKGSDTARKADRVRAQVSAAADGFSFQRRPYINPRTADTQLDSPAMRRLIQWVADTDSVDDIIRWFGDLPRQQLQQLVVANDPDVVRGILRKMWGIEIPTVPRARRTTGQVVAGRTGPTARDRVERRPSTNYLTTAETEWLTDLLNRQRTLNNAEKKDLLKLSARRSGGNIAWADAERAAAHGAMDLPGASVAKDYGMASMWRTRWISEGGSDMVILDRDNIPLTLDRVRNWLDTIGASRKDRDRLLRRILFADDTMASWGPIGTDARRILEDVLEAQGIPTKDVEIIMEKFTWFRSQAELFDVDLAGNPLHSSDVKATRSWGGVRQQQTVAYAPEPGMEGELARRHPVLPSITDVRRATGKYREWTDKARLVKTNGQRLGLNQSVIQTGLNVAMGVWKDGALLRFAWPIKIVFDELLRIAAVGYAELMTPWSLIAYAANKGDMSLVGGSIADQAQAQGGVGTGLQSNLKTGSPLTGTPFDPTDANWEMGSANSKAGAQSMLHRLQRIYSSPSRRRVAATSVDEAHAYYTTTPSGLEHLEDMVTRSEPGIAMSKVNDPTDNYAALRRVLEQHDAMIAQAAGGDFMYRPAQQTPRGQTLGPWTYNTGVLVPVEEVPKRLRPDQQIIIGHRGHQWVRDLIARGHTGTRRPDESVWHLIDSVLAGESEGAYRYYPIPADDGTAFGLEGYDATRIVSTFAEAEKAAGKGGRVAFLTEGQAKRLANDYKRTGDELLNIRLVGDEVEPRKVALSAVDEYRSGGHHLLDTPFDPTEPLPGDEPADIYFDAQLDGRERTEMAEALRRRFTQMGTDPETGKIGEIWTGPSDIPIPRTRPAPLQTATNFREHMYHWLGAVPTTVVSRHPMLRMTYWDEVARNYIFAKDTVRTEILARAAEAGMESHFDKLIRKQMRNHGYTDLPVGPRTSHSMDLVDIDKLAMHVSTTKVRDLLYDLTKTGNIADAARLLVPFGDAWWEVLTRWSRLMSPTRNPRALRNWRRVEQTMQEVSQSGWFEEDQFGNEVFRLPHAMSFLSNVAIGTTFDPASMLFIDPTSSTGWFPGASPIAQTLAAFTTPSFPPGLRDLTNTAIFGDFPATERSFTSIVKSWLPTPYKRAVDAIFADQNRDVMGSTKIGVQMALYASGDPRYDYTTLEGRKNAEAAADKAGSALTWFRLLGSIFLPGQPQYEASLRIQQDYADGTVGMEWLLADAGHREFQAALSGTGSEQAAYAYFVNRFGPDPLAFVGASQKIYERPLTREAWDQMRQHPELEEHAKGTLMAFLEPDPQGDFWELAFQDTFHKGTRIEIQPDSVGENAAVAAGWMAKENTNARFEAYRQQAVDMFGYGTEPYYAYMRELRTARQQENDGHTAEFFGGDPTGNITGEVVKYSYGKMLAELVEIGTPGTAAYEALRPINPGYVDILTAIADMLKQAEAMTPPAAGRSSTWWMTSEYGDDAAGDPREANFIKESFQAGLLNLQQQALLMGPEVQQGLVWAVDQVIAPMLSGMEDSMTWFPQPVQWPAPNPAQIQQMLDDTTPVPDSVPAYTSQP